MFSFGVYFNFLRLIPLKEDALNDANFFVVTHLCTSDKEFRNALHFGADVISLIQDAVDGFGDGNVGLEVFVHLVDALHGIVTFGDLAHLELGDAHGESVANHVAEHAVAAIAGVGGDEQVTEIDRVVEAAGAGKDSTDEVLHLLHTVGDVGRDEVVAVAEAAVSASAMTRLYTPLWCSSSKMMCWPTVMGRSVTT